MIGSKNPITTDKPYGISTNNVTPVSGLRFDRIESSNNVSSDDSTLKSLSPLTSQTSSSEVHLIVLSIQKKHSVANSHPMITRSRDFSPILL